MFWELALLLHKGKHKNYASAPADEANHSPWTPAAVLVRVYAIFNQMQDEEFSLFNV